VKRGPCALSALVLVLAAALHPGNPRAGELRPAPGTFALELGGAQVGLVHSANGGEVSAEEIPDILGKGQLKEHHFRDLALEVGAGMSPAVYDWIASTWQGKYRLATGAVLTSNSSLEILARREFTGTLSETTLPALDVASKEPAYLAFKIQLEDLRSVKGPAGSGSKVSTTGSKPWTRSNFRLEIPGLDCSHVTKIDAMTVTSGRDRIEFPHITLTLSDGSESWRAWFQSLVIGNNDDKLGKNGELVFLAPDMATELGRVHLFSLKMMIIQTQKVATASDPANTVIVSLSCDHMEFDWKTTPPAH